MTRTPLSRSKCQLVSDVVEENFVIFRRRLRHFCENAGIFVYIEVVICHCDENVFFPQRPVSYSSSSSTTTLLPKLCASSSSFFSATHHTPPQAEVTFTSAVKEGKRPSPPASHYHFRFRLTRVRSTPRSAPVSPRVRAEIVLQTASK